MKSLWHPGYCSIGYLHGFRLLVQIRASVTQTSQGLPNLNIKEKNEMNSVLSIVVNRRHRANGPYGWGKKGFDRTLEC